MNTKHTPGPWEMRDHGPGSGCNVSSSDGVDVAWCGADWSSRHGDTPYKANARLIAAAPDLLAACEAALDLMRDQGLQDGCSVAWEQILAAIEIAKEKDGAA